MNAKEFSLAIKYFVESFLFRAEISSTKTQAKTILTICKTRLI